MRRRRHTDLAAQLAQGLLASVAAGALLRRALRTSRRDERPTLPILLLPPVAPISVRARVEQIADRNPEQLAAQIRAWLRDR